MSKIGVPMLSGSVPEDHMLSQAFRSQYWRKVKSIRPGSLYAYWPVWEPSGTDVQDYSGNGDRATSTGLGVRAANPEGDHQTGVFSGAPSHINLLSAEFTAHFNGLEGTAAGWSKLNSVGLWSDGIGRYIVAIVTDGANFLWFYKAVANNSVSYRLYGGGGGSVVNSAVFNPGAAWFMWGMTWSRTANQFKAYYNGAQLGTTQTVPSPYAGAPTKALIGALDTLATNPWAGYMAHIAFWNVPLNASEMKSFAEV